jgi:outer membrane protein assembly factor BamD
LYFLAMSHHELGADDWARESLVLLTEKYPDSKAAGNGKRMLAKLGGAKPAPLFAQNSDSSSIADIGPTAAWPQASNLFSIPSSSSPQPETLGVPSSGALGQAFTACRLGVWC